MLSSRCFITNELSSLNDKLFVAQLCPTLWDPMDPSLPGSSVLEFSRQEYWSGLPFPSPGDLPDPRIKPETLTSPALIFMIFSGYVHRSGIARSYGNFLVS